MLGQQHAGHHQLEEQSAAKLLLAPAPAHVRINQLLWTRQHAASHAGLALCAELGYPGRKSADAMQCFAEYFMQTEVERLVTPSTPHCAGSRT